MARESCYNNFEQDCGTYKNGYQGTYSYILFEVPSLIMGFFVLEKLIILFFNRNFGNRVIFYIFLFLHWILHLLATIIWFSYSNSEFSSARIISKTGPIIAITNIIWQTLTDLIIFYSIHKEQIENEPSCFIEDIKCCKINPRIWMGISLALMMIGFGLVLASVGSESWLNGSEYSGNLVNCDHCYPLDNLSWTCLAGTECESNSDSDSCKFYSKIANAGTAYLILSSFTILFLLLAAQPIIASIISRNYGINTVNIVIFI